MRPCFHIKITTPKKVMLNGLWWGPARAKHVFIFVHGLTGSAFSSQSLVDALASRDTAVLTFNNRAFEQVSTYKRKRGKQTQYLTGGTAHEVFTECVDDIAGATSAAKKNGATHITLVGHSTGANKVVYWASKKTDSRVRGLVLLGPLSDYSGALKQKGARALSRAVAHAKKLVAAGKPHELMPAHFGEWFACDAQRFLSLYTPESKEEVFTYTRPDMTPAILQKVRIPILAILAGADEYSDMPVARIGDWFAEHLKVGDQVAVIPRVGHSFKEGEKNVAALMRNFMKGR
jgi:pimeloyl-ACP methyl ester carboxylesterase